jgi:hypothetical protein
VTDIDKYTTRGIPPTSQMVKNFAEEMSGRGVDKNWGALSKDTLT